MQFETQRLTLRTWQPELDARHAMDIYGDPRVMAWIEEGRRDSSIRQVQGRLQRYLNLTQHHQDGTGGWAVAQKDIGRVIGQVVLMPLPDIKQVRAEHESSFDPEGLETNYIEIGWHFRPASWGYGYATEAALCIAQYAFAQLNHPLLLAVCDPANRRSIALMERLGMCYDGMTTRYYGGQELFLYKLYPEALAAAQRRWQPASLKNAE